MAVVSTLITSVLRQLSPPRKRNQMTQSSEGGDLEAGERQQESERDEGDRADHGKQAAARECLAVGQAAAHHEQDHRQGGDDHADHERPQTWAGLVQGPEAVAVRERSTAETDRDPDQGADRLIGGPARCRALLLQLVGDLGLDLGQDVVRGVGGVLHSVSPRRAG